MTQVSRDGAEGQRRGIVRLRIQQVISFVADPSSCTPPPPPVYIDLKYVLELLQGPILALFQSTSNMATNPSCPAAALPSHLESLRLICRIWFSLNWLDLPEYFEDHMKEWMDEFAKFLR